MRVALYLRRSTVDLQPDSLAVQEAVLRRHADENGFEVVEVFKDSASGRSIKKRTDFKRLIQTIEQGAPFESVLVRDVSRFGRFENTDEHAYWEFFFLTRGIRTLYVDESFRDDDYSPYAVLMKNLKRVLASEFSREKAERTRFSQARVVSEGFVHGGPAPYGLRRVLVRLDGTFVADLPKGERKWGTNRIKFVPGDIEEIRNVQRIFEMYGDEGLASPQIAARLNGEGAKPPNVAWYGSHVIRVLHNEAYVGTLSYTFEQNRSVADRRAGKKKIVRKENAIEPVISRELWDRVQQRLAQRTWKKNDADLLLDLRVAFERWGCVEPEMLTSVEKSACWQTYGNRFPGGHQQAMALAFEQEIAAAKLKLREDLSKHLLIEDRGDDWLVNGHLLVGLKVSFPEPRFRSLRWRFEFNKAELPEVFVGLGFAPPPATVQHVQSFVFNAWRFRSPTRTVFPSLEPKSWPAPFAPKTTVQLADALTYSSFHRSAKAEDKLIEKLGEYVTVNISQVARELGWPYETTRRIYRRLLLRNPILARQVRKNGRRIEVSCSSCGNVRRFPPLQAFQLTTDLCGECYRDSRKRPKATVRCPECGEDRQVHVYVIKKLSQGTNSPCHACMLARGRRKRAENVQAYQKAKATKLLALEPLATAMVDAMASQPTLYRTPTIWHEGSARFPSIYWSDPSSRTRCRVVLHCDDEFPFAYQRLHDDCARRKVVDMALDSALWERTAPTTRAELAWKLTLTAGWVRR